MRGAISFRVVGEAAYSMIVENLVRTLKEVLLNPRLMVERRALVFEGSEIS